MAVPDPTKDPKRLRTYGQRKPVEMVEFQDLPAWVRTVAAMHDLLGMSWEEAAKRCGRAGGSASQYNKSPAFQRWREELKTVANDPIKMAEYILKASAASVTVDYFAAYEKANEAGDFNAVSKMSQDLLDRIGITRKKDNSGSGNIKIELTLGGGMAALEPPRIVATHEEVEEKGPDFEIVEEEDA